jgi:ABC-type branched-subunit amino acid transport system substrate-binding protein
MREESYGFASLVPAIVGRHRHRLGFRDSRRMGRECPRRHGCRDQDWPDLSLQRTGFWLRHDRQSPGRLLQDDQRGGRGQRPQAQLISLDDGYSAPKTVEQTRRLIEEDGVAFTFQSFGGFTNLAVRPYLNANKVPQLFVAAGADQLDDPQNFPWTIGFNPATSTEGRVYTKHILATKPGAKIGVLYQNDQLGKTFLAGVRDALGAEHAGQLVKEVSYEVADPTVDSQAITLQGAGVGALIIAATAKPAARPSAKSMTSAGRRNAICSSARLRSPQR